MSKKIVDYTLAEEVIKHGRKIKHSMSSELINAVIELIGGDENFKATHKEVVQKDVFDSTFSSREIYRFFILNKEDLLEYNELMASHTCNGGLIELLMSESGEEKYMLDKVARATYGTPDNIYNISELGLFVAKHLIHRALSDVAACYHEMTEDAYKRVIGHKNRQADMSILTG